MAGQYAPVATRLTAAYGATAGRLRPFADDFTRDVLAIDPRRLDASALGGLSSYQTLLVRLEAELSDFARIAQGQVSGAADDATAAGIDSARQIAIAVARRQNDAVGALVGAAWVSPAPEAVARLIDYADGAPARTRWDAFGANAAQTIADTLIAGIAQGKNPREIAGLLMTFVDGVPLAWAETTARTSVLWSYRAANHATFAANSDVVEGWRWSSAKDLRTCPSCWAMDGRIFPLTEVLNDHHNGRCAPIPVVRGAQWVRDLPSGAEVFAGLPAAQQRAILGAGAFDLYRDGRVTLNDFSRTYNDPIYGDMRRAATLGELTGRGRTRTPDVDATPDAGG